MKSIYYILVLSICSIAGCEDFVEIDSPSTDLVRSAVFSNEATAEAAMLDIYYSMHYQGFASGDSRSWSYFGSISADEQMDYTTGGSALLTGPFYDHSLTPTHSQIAAIWSRLYLWIYKSNAILEGVKSSTALSETLKRHLEGEAKFIRAFSYYYLVNLWGPVPLVLTTHYDLNRSLPRASEDEVYAQIIRDLMDAQILLPADYALSGNERTRANKWAATALLSRTYLHVGDWVNAEGEATSIIQNSNQYTLQLNLHDVFKANNSEAIWQYFPTTTNLPWDYVTFYIRGSLPSNGALEIGLVDAFELSDQRRMYWIDSINGPNGEVYYFSTKYHSSIHLEQYSTIMRLAEQYLIRAEARALQNDLAGAQEDLNIIRNRAGLGDVVAADKTALIEAIHNERRLELFTEWGHRWIDLKRVGKIDEVLAPLKPKWRPEAALFPIPESQILNSSVEQNPGY